MWALWTPPSPARFGGRPGAAADRGAGCSDDFSPRTKSGGTSARDLFNESHAFTLRLDGSVKKITVAGLAVAACQTHATWRVARGLAE